MLESIVIAGSEQVEAFAHQAEWEALHLCLFDQGYFSKTNTEAVGELRELMNAGVLNPVAFFSLRQPFCAVFVRFDTFMRKNFCLA